MRYQEMFLQEFLLAVFYLLQCSHSQGHAFATGSYKTLQTQPQEYTHRKFLTRTAVGSVTGRLCCAYTFNCIFHNAVSSLGHTTQQAGGSNALVKAHWIRIVTQGRRGPPTLQFHLLTSVLSYSQQLPLYLWTTSPLNPYLRGSQQGAPQEPLGKAEAVPRAQHQPWSQSCWAQGRLHPWVLEGQGTPPPTVPGTGTAPPAAAR